MSTGAASGDDEAGPPGRRPKRSRGSRQGQSRRRRVDRRTRRPSKSIPLGIVTEVNDAWRHAQTLGYGCNVLLTLRPRHMDSLSPEQRQAEWKKYRDRMAQFARYHGFTLVYIWSRESDRGSGTGEHLHMLVHIPPELQARFTTAIKRWAKHPDEVHIRDAGYTVWWTKRGHKRSARAYLTKNSFQAWRYKRETWKPGGPIMGKRVGWTTNLGARARAEFQAARRAARRGPPSTSKPEPLF